MFSEDSDELDLKGEASRFRWLLAPDLNRRLLASRGQGWVAV